MEIFNYADQTQLFNRNNCPSVHIVGAGGATNAVIICLATMGVQAIHVYDKDVLEGHNGPGEPMYSDRDIGKPKVEAAANTFAYLRSSSDAHIEKHEVFVDETAEFDGIVISGLDSMRARKKVWTAVKNSPMVPLYVDLRSSGTSLTVLIVDPLDDKAVDIYESTWLYSDEEAVQEVCGARNIPYIAFAAAALAGHIVACYTNNTLRDMYSDGIEETFYFAEQKPFA